MALMSVPLNRESQTFGWSSGTSGEEAAIVAQGEITVPYIDGLALLGAAFILLVDTLARTMARIETPIGILTAVVGAPFFLWLLARGRRTWG